MAEQSGDLQKPMQLEAEQVRRGRPCLASRDVSPQKAFRWGRSCVQEHDAAQPSITTAAQALDLNCKGLVDQIYDSASASSCRSQPTASLV
jgi:hypothetical protein